MYREEASDEEIIDRFRKLFGREMTPEEKKCFLLPTHPKQTETNKTAQPKHHPPTAT